MPKGLSSDPTRFATAILSNETLPHTLQVNRPLTMKKENIQKRKRKPKSSAANDSQALTQNPVVSVQQQHLHLLPHASTQTHHHQLNSSHTHHTHIHQHVHHNSHSASQHSNQGQLHVHHSAASQQHMLANAITANQLQQASSNGNALIHQSVSNGSSSHHHPSHNLSQVSTPKDLIQNLNQASSASNSTNGNNVCTSAHLNRALHLNRLDDLTMAMAAGSANGVLSNLSNSNGGSAAQALNANNLIIVDSASLHPLTKFSDVLYHQNNGAMIANLGAGGHHLEHSLSSSSGANELSSEHSPNSEVHSPNTPSSSMLTRQIIPVDQFFYPNANVKVEAKNC